MEERNSPGPATSGAPSQANATTVQLPDFWQNNPHSWFNAVEAQFNLQGISVDVTKFYHIVAKLDNNTAQHVESLIDQPTESDKYGALKAALIQQFTPSAEERAERPLALTEGENDMPASLMEKLLRLKDSDDDHFIFTHLFLRTLLSAARAVLASSPLLVLRDYRALGREAQRIVNATKRRAATAAAAELGATTADDRRPETAVPDSPTMAAARARECGPDVFCFYHRRFAERARKCVPPCQFGQRQDRGLVAAAALGEENKLLYLSDARSGRQFLVDTGSQLSFITPSYTDRLAGSGGPLVTAANGSEIKTFAPVAPPTAQANVTTAGDGKSPAGQRRRDGEPQLQQIRQDAEAYPACGLMSSRKQMLDEAQLNFMVKDCQPLSIVKSEGFRELVQALQPLYVLPTRKTIKQMVAKKYEEERERVKKEVQQAVAVSITADMWTSVNMEAYLALTCHYINENLQLCTSVLGVQYFPQSHTADNLAQVKRGMMEDWAITNKVKCQYSLL
ncbi:uncharacterized protein KZ484_003063 [Pholidichthys leucotaenia]